jgi:biofilm PGA synthesis N-glycosyltransferase PgaC
MGALIFLVSIALIAYILFGYPILLALIARLRPRLVRKGAARKPVSVIIPVHNGARFIAAKLDSVLSLDYPPGDLEIVVVSDGSTDETDVIVQGFAGKGVRLIPLPRGGKCAALNAGISQTKNEILLLTDVRQIVAPDSLKNLVGCFADPAVGAVSGELLIRASASSDEVTTGLYWRYESWIRRNSSLVDSMFGATGPFYAIRRELAVPLPPDILLDDMYLPLAGFFRGYRLIAEPSAKAFDFPTSREVEFKRKVRTLAGNYQILKVYPGLLGPGNRMWFHFVSYKLARLMLPWLVLAAFVSSWFLPPPFRIIALGLQCGFYALAALDPLIPAKVPVKRLSSLARTFVALLAAAVFGLSILVVPPRSLWKETKIATHHS